MASWAISSLAFEDDSGTHSLSEKMWFLGNWSLNLENYEPWLTMQTANN